MPHPPTNRITSVVALKTQLKDCMRADYFRLSRRLRQLEKRPNAKQCETLQKQIDQSIQRRALRQQSVPRLNYPEDLPVSARREEIAQAIQQNQIVLVCGETGSGKTTMLNALSKMIDPGERVLTIEDAAELRLQQPHWLPLETRPANLEGQGEISIRDLVKNALRMRPDRIILGEIRGSECFDMLAAMNTGHDGSMCTLHANSPREALARMENMVMMSDIKVPKEAISRQIADSVEMIIQVKRLRDGSRRVTNVTEVIGMEGPVIVTQELFKFEYLDESADGKIIGEYRSMGLRPYTLEKARQFGFDQAYLEACL